MYDSSRKPSPYANYDYLEHTIPYMNVEQAQQYYTPYYNELSPKHFNPQLANIKPVKYYTKTQISPKGPAVNLPTNLPKPNKQFNFPLKTCLIKPNNELESKDPGKGLLRDFCSFWTKPCVCEQKPDTFRTNLRLPSSSRDVLNKVNITNNVKTDCKEPKPTENTILKPKTVVEKVEKKVIHQPPTTDLPINTDQKPDGDQKPHTISLSENVTEISKVDIKPISISDIHVSLAEKLSNKLEQAQERILELEREKILLEQSITAMKIEMEEYINCVKQSEAVMDTHYNYSTAILNSIIDFCCSLSTPNKHHEVRHAVRTFALDLFQLLVNNNAPNNHIAELISLNGILAETSYVDVLNTPKQLATSTAKAVFKSSKPLSSIRPL